MCLGVIERHAFIDVVVGAFLILLFWFVHMACLPLLQDLLLGNRKNKSAGPTNFLDSIYKSVAASTSNIQRPSTDPGTFGNGLGFGGNVSGGKVGARNGFSLGGARTETIQDLDDQIQRASKFLSPAVYTAAKSSATSPRRQRQLEQARKQPALSHRIW